MIKYTYKDENILSENPLESGVTVTCFARQKNNYQLLFAIIKDDNTESLTVVMSSSNMCSARTITGRNAIYLRNKLIDIYKNNDSHKLEKLCPNIQNFKVVDSALFTDSELQGILCKEIAKRLECTHIWIEDEQLDNVPEYPSANFIYIKDKPGNL